MTSAPSSPAIPRLRLFSLLWAAANVVHQLRHPVTDLTPLTHITGMTGVLSLAVFTFAAIAIVFPRGSRPLVAMAAAATALTAIKYPMVPNHDVIMMAVNLLIIVSWAASRQWRRPKEGAWFTTFEPVARLGFIAAYGAAAISKLNWSFFDPDVSCAPGLFGTSFGNIDLFDLIPPTLIIVAVAATELAIPVTLLFQRTRAFGVVLALVFHFVLVIHPDAPGMGFTWVLYALVALFLPQSAVEACVGQLRAIAGRFTIGSRRLLPCLLAATFTLIGVEVWVFYTQNFSLQISWSLPLYAAAAVMALMVWSTVRTRSGQLPTPTFSFGRLPQALILAVVLLNAAAPYLGGKTTTSFTMYSNLRTEGLTSNHFFIPRLPWETAQDDLVEIVSSSNRLLERYAERGARLTHHELRRILAASPDVAITYVRDGKTSALERASDDPSLTTTDWSHKIVHHRPVYENGACSW